jgi:hypothetical protein
VIKTVFHQEAHKNPLYKDMISRINKLIQKYSLCKVFIDSSAANVCHELAHQYGEYQAYEKLDPKILEIQVYRMPQPANSTSTLLQWVL